MSLNFENKGVPIALIKNSKKKDTVMCVDSEESSKQGFSEFKTGKDEKFQVIPDTSRERTIVYITAASGAGKSYWCCEYIKEYLKIHPKNNIYLFSSISDDSSIDKIKKLKRINIKGPDFLTSDFTAEDFEKSLTIFDDCDCITDKKTKLKVFGIQNSLLETGRHFNCEMLITSHLPTNGNDTKRTLNECNKIVIFPHSLGARSLKYLLENYLGLDKNQIKKIKKLKSRYVCINKTYPMSVISERESYVLNTEDI